MRSSSTSSRPIYFEKQASSLCGQHALNNLVQRPAFSVGELSDVAAFLDDSERRIMQGGGGGGNNVSESGDFSVAVLSEALTQKFGCWLAPMGKQEVREEISERGIDREYGFIVNLRDHWFALRRIRGRLWLLNSMADQPMLVNPFAQEATLSEYAANGGSIFVVRGKDLPAPLSDGDVGEIPKFSEESKWFEEDFLLRLAQGKSATDWGALGRGQRLDGTRGTSPVLNSAENDEEAQIRLALALSMQDQQQQCGNSPSLDSLLSGVTLKPEPDTKEPGTVRIQIRLPGSRVVRRFSESDSSLQVWVFVKSILSVQGNFELIRAGGGALDPVKASEGTIASEGLGGSSILVRPL